MLNKNIVIASHSLEEAITKCVIKNKSNFKANIVIISLKDLLSDYEIFDEINDLGTIIKWNSGTQSICNQDFALLNRVLYFPDDLFNGFIKDDKEYARREFEAYI